MMTCTIASLCVFMPTFQCASSSIKRHLLHFYTYCSTSHFECCALCFRSLQTMLWHSLWSQRRVSPAFRCSESERRHSRIFIVGDTAVTKVPKTNILSATLLLLVSHYVFDLEYFRFYANLLGVLQTLTIMWRTPASSSNFSLRNCVLLFKLCRSHYPRLTTSYPVTLTTS